MIDGSSTTLDIPSSKNIYGVLVTACWSYNNNNKRYIFACNSHASLIIAWFKNSNVFLIPLSIAIARTYIRHILSNDVAMATAGKNSIVQFMLPLSITCGEGCKQEPAPHAVMAIDAIKVIEGLMHVPTGLDARWQTVFLLRRVLLLSASPSQQVQSISDSVSHFEKRSRVMGSSVRSFEHCSGSGELGGESISACCGAEVEHSETSNLYMSLATQRRHTLTSDPGSGAMIFAVISLHDLQGWNHPSTGQSVPGKYSTPCERKFTTHSRAPSERNGCG